MIQILYLLKNGMNLSFINSISTLLSGVFFANLNKLN